MKLREAIPGIEAGEGEPVVWARDRRVDDNSLIGWHYEPMPIGEALSLSYSDLSRDGSVDGAAVFLPAYFGFSDYSGCAVERSNLQAFHELFEGREWWRKVWGDFGSEALALILDAEIDAEDAEALTDLLRGLDDYPCIDDQLLFEIERDAETEAWADWGRSDFRRLLGEAWEDSEDEELDEAFETAREAANEYWQIETGGAAWIDLERVAAKVPARA
jgi:hypothetical protein